MNIMITSNSAWNILHFRRPLINHFLSQQHNVMTLAPTDGTEHRLIELGCHFIPLDMAPHGTHLAENLKITGLFRTKFYANKPDLILSFTIKNNIYGAAAAKSLSLPFIPTVTGLGKSFLSNFSLQLIAVLLYRRAFKNLPIVVFQNHEDLESFKKHKIIVHQKTSVTPGSGLNTEYYKYTPIRPNQTTTFLMVARLSEEKGLIEFLQAAKNAKQLHPNARFQLLGKQQCGLSSSLQLLKEHVRTGIVEYLGETDDVRPYICDATCVVLPSYREGAPRALLEAAAMGRPIITTDVPGCRSIVTQNHNGLLCTARDTKSLTSAILKFMNFTYEEIETMGQRGRATVINYFNESIVVEAYQSAINCALSTRRKFDAQS